MRYNGVFFDLDGTLLNTLGDLTAAVNFVLGSYGYPTRTAEEVRSFIGDGFDTLIQRACPEDVSFEDTEKAAKLFSEYYTAHIADTTVAYDGITELVNKLSDEGYRLGVVSNKRDSALKSIVKMFFGDTFSVVLGERGGNTRKPSPVLCIEGMKALSLSPERTFYIGDSPSDITTAFNAGMIPIGVTWGFRSKEALEKAGAVLIADSAEQLYCIINGKNR